MNVATPKHNEEQAVALGHKLGVLIAALEVAEEVRDAVVAILPELTFEQLTELADFLETSAIQNETSDLDFRLKQEVERIKAEYDTVATALQAQTSAELDAVAAKLKQ